MLKKSATVWYGATSLSSLYVTVVTSMSLSAMLSCTSVAAASLTLGIILNGSMAFASGLTAVSVTTSSAITPLASVTSSVNSSPRTLFDASIALFDN